MIYTSVDLFGISVLSLSLSFSTHKFIVASMISKLDGPKITRWGLGWLLLALDIVWSNARWAVRFADTFSSSYYDLWSSTPASFHPTSSTLIWFMDTIFSQRKKIISKRVTRTSYIERVVKGLKKTELGGDACLNKLERMMPRWLDLDKSDGSARVGLCNGSTREGANLNPTRWHDTL